MTLLNGVLHPVPSQEADQGGSGPDVQRHHREPDEHEPYDGPAGGAQPGHHDNTGSVGFC